MVDDFLEIFSKVIGDVITALGRCYNCGNGYFFPFCTGRYFFNDCCALYGFCKYNYTVKNIIVDYVENPCILSVESYPGNNYAYCLDNVNAVILKPYHSGTLDTANRCLVDFCNRAKSKNIPVFVTGTHYGVAYKSTELYSDLGVKLVPYGTYISAYMKIWAGISLSQNLEDFVNTRIANE